MSIEWQNRTEAGVFRIVQERGRYHVTLDDEDLGDYHSAVTALKRVRQRAQLHARFSGVTKPEPPEDLSKWTLVECAE